MDFTLTDAQSELRAVARQFSEEVVSRVAFRQDREEKLDLEVIAAAGKLGFCGVTVPREYGGMGLGNLELALVLEEVNRVCASTGVTLSVQNSLVNGPIVKFGTEAQKRAYLPKLASGEWLGAYSLSEMGSGSDAAALVCRAEKTGEDGYRISGVKSWVTTGQYARALVVMARTGEHKSRGITAFLIDTDKPGYKVSKAEVKLGLRGSATNELSFDGYEVTAADRLGDEGYGFKIALDTLDGGRIGIATQALGIARACLEASLEYAKTHLRDGARLADDQAIQFKVAEMSARLDAARWQTWHAAWLRDRKQPCGREAAEAKLLASTLANDAAREAIEIHGADGYLRGSAVERFYRDARITEIYEGTTEIQKIVIARHLLRD